MRNAFWVTPHKQFRESLHHARGRIPTCNDGITQYDWSHRIWNQGPGGQASLAYPPGGSSSTAKVYGITFNGRGQSRSFQSGVFSDQQDGITDAANNDNAVPNTRSKGRWKISVRLTANYPIRPDSGTPRKHWLFLNVTRGRRVNPVEPVIEQRVIILNDGNHIGITQDAVSSIPLESRIRFTDGANLLATPELINSTWKWDLSAITASPASPYIFEDYLVIDPVHYCDPLFYSHWNYFTGRAISGNPFQPHEQSVGLDVPDGYTVLSGQTNFPGDWNIPAPAIFNGGPLPRDSGISDSSLNDTTLAQIDLTALRIPTLVPLFSIRKTGFRTYQFTDISLGDPTSWAWDFGDLGASVLRNPVHTFPHAGPFTIRLTIGNQYGESATEAVPHGTA